MDKVRIGVYDNEKEYVERLSAFMNKTEKNRWRVGGFTEMEIVEEQLEKNKLDLLISTEEEKLETIKKNYPQLNCVYLSGEDKRRKSNKGISFVFRYQNARILCEEIKNVIEGLGMLSVKDKTSIAVYSPVSRCGKTSLLVEAVLRSPGWLYVGMEDYGYLQGIDNAGADDFFYYIKERKADMLTGIIQASNGVIPSPFSFFDTRGLDCHDLEWFFEVFEKLAGYRGVIFDIGLGIMLDFSMLSVFDIVIVPYINDEISLGKKERFEELIKVFDMEELFERIRYLDMKNEPDARLRRLMG